MAELSRDKFLTMLPELVVAHLPAQLQGIQARQPFRWLVQFHYGEPTLHYEVSPAWRHGGWELGLHFEAKDSRLNLFLLKGFRRHLFEIKEALGEGVEAEMWDKGWTKIYEVVPASSLSTEYQMMIGSRLATIISCLHPVFIELRGAVAEVYR